MCQPQCPGNQALVLLIELSWVQRTGSVRIYNSLERIFRYSTNVFCLCHLKWVNKFVDILLLIFQEQDTWSRCVCPTMHWALLALSWCWRLSLSTVLHTWICPPCAKVLLITCSWNTSPTSCHRYTHESCSAHKQFNTNAIQSKQIKAFFSL